MRYIYVFGICIIILLASAVSNAQQAGNATADLAMNRLITFSGILIDANKQPMLGSAVITFSIYATQEGGYALWHESQIVQLDEQGGYTVLIGATEKEGLPLELFNSGKAQWLGMEVQGEIERPRVLLWAVPYALKAADADTVGGKPSSHFVMYEDLAKAVDKLDQFASIDGQSVTIGGRASGSGSGASRSRKSGTGTNNLTGPTITNPDQLFGVSGFVGTPGYLGKFASSGDLENSAIFQSGSNIGIGTTSPLSKFTVNVGTDQNFDVMSDGGLTTIRAVNDAGTANAPFQLYGSRYAFMQGNVGIGTTAPWDKLSVSNGSENGSMTFQRGIGGYTNWRIGTDAYADFYFAQSAGLPDFDSTAGRVVIKNGGNVGIGTMSPASKLTVEGNVEVKGPGNGILFSDGSALTSGSAARVRGITYLAGCDTCSVLADTDDQRTIYFNLVGPMTINSVTCFSDAGTPTINLQRDSDGLANILSSNLACSTTGTTSTGIVPAQNTLNLSDKVDFVVVSAGGVAKRVTVAIKATVN